MHKDCMATTGPDYLLRLGGYLYKNKGLENLAQAVWRGALISTSRPARFGKLEAEYYCSQGSNYSVAGCSDPLFD